MISKKVQTIALSCVSCTQEECLWKEMLWQVDQPVAPYFFRDSPFVQAPVIMRSLLANRKRPPLRGRDMRSGEHALGATTLATCHRSSRRESCCQKNRFYDQVSDWNTKLRGMCEKL